MHGLINRAIERFVRDSYGRDMWAQVAARAGLDVPEFEAMLHYETQVTFDVLDALAGQLDKSRDEILEDIGTYLISHPNVAAVRRLLRFGGADFVDFLHSLDDLPGRVRLAVDDLDMPDLELREHGAQFFSLICRSPVPGFGHVMVGVLRAMADDYGALAFLEHKGRLEETELIEIRLLSVVHGTGRTFTLGAEPAGEEGMA